MNKEIVKVKRMKLSHIDQKNNKQMFLRNILTETQYKYIIIKGQILYKIHVAIFNIKYMQSMSVYKSLLN
jgi:hypothetical protein